MFAAALAAISPEAKLDPRIAALSVMDLESGKELKYRELLKHPKLGEIWNGSSSNEFDRLAQGKTGRVKGTDTIDFIHYDEIPQDQGKDVTYASFVCSIRPGKSEPNRVRAVAGGNNINFPDDVGTPTAELLLIKILFNSVISTTGAKFMTIDIANFYFNTPLTQLEYLKLNMRDIPDKIIKLYNIK